MRLFPGLGQKLQVNNSDIPDFWIWGVLGGPGGPKSGPRDLPRAPRPARNVNCQRTGVGDLSAQKMTPKMMHLLGNLYLHTNLWW